ncbi:SpoIIE family protein phosphatase [Streptomyces pactum]|uniref:SpoIIE family protein phosphatase n=1 Tax=Streptomyces pactum TaxID=68249 RepID=A0ABS0NEX6_9ACTN|nr:SpoIIE family protein phosphatase [Streptomyces pactum]MBH5333721.1 SpoIIE family protein phosphatase [Streptomyces pactum]
MGAQTGPPVNGSGLFDAVATAVLAADGTVVRWSRAAAELVGRPGADVLGRPVRTLLAATAGSPGPAGCPGGVPPSGRVLLDGGDGRTVDVTFRVMPLDGSAELLVAAVPSELVEDWSYGASLLRAVFGQDLFGIGLHDTTLRTVRSNATGDPAGGPALTFDSVPDLDARATLRRVLETGVPVFDRVEQVDTPGRRSRTVSLSAFRLQDHRGRPLGVASALADVTTRQRARDHLALLNEAATRIGGSLDVTSTAEQVAGVLVPGFADLVGVDIAEAVLAGEEPPQALGARQHPLRRVATASATGEWPDGLLAQGERVPRIPDFPALRRVQQGEVVLTDRERAVTEFRQDGLARRLVPPEGRSLAVAPLFARGLMLGTVMAWRTERSGPFRPDDAALLREIVSRAAVTVDNARRFTREHRTAIALQQSLLPPAVTDIPAAETAGLYLPAGGGVGGDWFDVIPLPSLRVALVVGDVVGRGLHATATMGRLRTAIQTLADLELDPKELLTHVEDLVLRLAREAGPGGQDAVGTSFLYGVYDPVTRRCDFASAGHEPPLLVRPDGGTEVVEIAAGPALGVGGLPFETTTVELPPGGVLVMYTDGLVERAGGRDEGLRLLTAGLTEHCRPDRPVDELGGRLLADLGGCPPRDDIALLLVRPRAVPAEDVAEWEFPADPAAVAVAREATTGRLTEWGLADLAFTTELVVSELVTNAIRYAGGPVGVRLIRSDVLVCEVTDPSNTQPRLRRARSTDEGGRGLFLVAQLTTRWGSRYGRQGKTIWAEQPLTPPEG